MNQYTHQQRRPDHLRYIDHADFVAHHQQHAPKKRGIENVALAADELGDILTLAIARLDQRRRRPARGPVIIINRRRHAA